MAFATTTDVGKRLGRSLTAAEDDAVELTIELVTGLIADAVSRDADWAEDLNPVPPLLRALCIEKAIGAITNTENLASVTRSLGAASVSKTFPRASDAGLFLTDQEGRMCRRAVYGKGTASPRVGSVLDDVYGCDGS